MKKQINYITLMILFLSLFMPSISAFATGRDLTNQVTLSDIIIKDSSGSKPLSGTNNTQTGTTKTLDAKVFFTGKYDLSSLGATLASGDYFTVSVPEYIHLVSGSYPLIHPETNIQLGTMVSDSDTGKITVTFNENIEQEANVKGAFSAESTLSLQEGSNQFTFPDGSTYEVVYNYVENPLDAYKIIGESIFKVGYNSNEETLGWQVRINRQKYDYRDTNVTVKDNINIEDNTLTTYLKDSFVLKKVIFDNQESFLPDVTSEENISITMNKEEFDAAPAGTIALLTIKDSGTAFELNLGNAVGTNSYLLEYRTTNPGDQTEISNAVSLLVGGEAQKTFDSYIGEDNTATQHTQKQIAIQKAGATIQSDLTGKIKITKYDADDATILLEGVVFVVTKEDDTSISYEITTDSKGVAITPELVPGTYTIVEKKSKAGYILDVNPKRAEMKIDKTPVRLNISNKKDNAVKPVDVTLKAKKELTGKALTDNQFTFELKNGDAVVATATNKADGTITFTPQYFDAEGTFTYTIVEKDDKQANVTYDITEKQVKVVVTKGDNNQLVATVTYDETETIPVFTNIYTEPKATPVDVTFQAKKELTGKALVDNQFTFELKNGDEVVATATNKADGTITFDTQHFDAEGTFTYTIVEKDDKQANVTYDITEKQVKVVVTKGDNNQLVATVTYDETETIPVFTNTYTEPKATPVDVMLKAKKELTGKVLVDNQFTFELKQGDEVVATATNKADGTITFTPQHFDAEGTFIYTISEKNDKQANITYDATEKQVKVVVTKGDNNQLVATVTYDETETIPVFTNTYTEPKATPVDVTLKAKKELTGKALTDNQFTFELKNGDAVLATATNKADGTITFTPQHFDAAGTFTYTISEKNDKQANITYDVTEKQVKVVVTKGDNNQLVATVTYDETETIPVFTNTYTEPKATPVDVTFQAKKELTGKVLVDNQFTFELKKDNAVIATATNKADGTITFTPQHFDAAGTFTYTISEKNDKQANITYDVTEKQVKVVVTKGDNNQLVATVTYDEAEATPVFTNTYTEPKATPVDVTLKAKKVLENKMLNGQDFMFVLKQNDTVIEQVSNKQDGKISFTPLSFDKVGTYYFVMNEVIGDNANITYDMTQIAITITVTEEAGRLVATVLYNGAPDEPVFVNTYHTPTVPPKELHSSKTTTTTTTPSRENEKPVLPKTGTNTILSSILMLVGFSLVLTSGIVYQYRQKS
ncbi:FctA domain-containing protein [Granulicatella sp. zg-84]|uniref:Spy0128 family protein n=1 Tax=Granulicatella sp. zg-84 TaxID=2678503 RepID=UPI0013C15EB0|nr:FctA domain-containing protein [Granulicatella sp. zg-84]NEW66481.1 hypothetical protein [Granulicatella sp. zg-84]